MPHLTSSKSHLMTSNTFSTRYPRRVVLRTILNVLGRLLFRLFARVSISGLENIPRRGPVILVGNHVDIMEVVLMVLFAHRHVEVLGTGDIPLDPTFAPIINAYGFLPINRGSMDRQGMTMALDVLKQNGVVGVFPEGGVWETSAKQARTGVAWLSAKANTPIVPIGFGGTYGALGEILRFKRPRMVMRVGDLIPPIKSDGRTRKTTLVDGANRVMEKIEALIPPEEKARWNQIIDERFELELRVCTPGGEAVMIPDHLNLNHSVLSALAKFFFRPVMLRTFARNLRLPVQPLQRLDHQPAHIASATQAILDYLQTNPYFLTYRFGNEEGGAMQTGLVRLHDVAQWAAQQGYILHLHAIRRYRQVDSPQEQVAYLSPNASGHGAPCPDNESSR